METQQSFGDFLMKKRTERDLTLREIATQMGVSIGFYNDVEKDRRNPFDRAQLEKVISILGLTEPDVSTLYNLAGKGRNSVAPDLPEYIMQRDYVSAALRTARDLGAGEQEWLQFVEELKRKKGK
ncbi:helix-turn-helix domain-containing protein [Ruminococcaceae bacterium OttesenSCG-928-A16]|nr:helix-turn-helix domain-containing protein [Ruminococcaceae bacterium OttesenSCG-928-A16]